MEQISDNAWKGPNPSFKLKCIYCEEHSESAEVTERTLAYR